MLSAHNLLATMTNSTKASPAGQPQPSRPISSWTCSNEQHLPSDPAPDSVSSLPFDPNLSHLDGDAIKNASCPASSSQRSCRWVSRFALFCLVRFAGGWVCWVCWASFVTFCSPVSLLLNIFSLCAANWQKIPKMAMHDDDVHNDHNVTSWWSPRSPWSGVPTAPCAIASPSFWAMSMAMVRIRTLMSGMPFVRCLSHSPFDCLPIPSSGTAPKRVFDRSIDRYCPKWKKKPKKKKLSRQTTNCR